MDTFLNTAYRYLKGNSELPSLLPSKESAHMAQEKSRKLRLFCKGLECFREIFYTEPMGEERDVDPDGERDDGVMVAGEEHSLGQDQTMMPKEEGQSRSAESFLRQDQMIMPIGEGHSKSPEAFLGQDEMMMTAGEGYSRSAEDFLGQDEMMMTKEEGQSKSAEAFLGQDQTIIPAGEGYSKPAEAFLGQDQTMMPTEEGHSNSKSAAQPNTSPSVVDTDREKSFGDEIPTSTNSVQDQGYANAETLVLRTKTDQKPRKYVLGPGENLFQSLFATDQTPPNSPGGGSSSSSTLVDPSSRKVSPSDTTMDGKSSPTVAKDFAYSSLDVKHVRDPLSIAEENSKLELSRQLKKKGKASRKAEEKRKAENLALRAQLDATEEKLRTKEVIADLRRVHMNAVILSNVALRHAMQDQRNARRDGQQGVEIETANAAGEPVGNQEGEGAAQDNLRPAGTSVASAYPHGTVFYDSPDEFGEGLARADAPVGLQQDQMPPMTSENAEVGHSRSTIVPGVDRQPSDEPQFGLIGSQISGSASEDCAEGLLGTSMEEVDDSSKETGSDELAPPGMMTSVESRGSKAFNEIKAQGQKDFTDDIGLASNQDDERSSSNINTDSWTEVKTECSDNSTTQATDIEKSSLPSTSMMSQGPGDRLPSLKGLSLEEEKGEDELTELHDQGHIPITHDQDSSPTVEHQANDKPVDSESHVCDEVCDTPTDDVGDETAVHENSEGVLFEEGTEDDEQGTCVGREGDSHDSFEFSEPAGPATLWGILQTRRGEDEAAKEANAVKEAANVFDAAAGPATLWGILHSNQSQHQAKDKTVADDHTAEGYRGAPKPPNNSPAAGYRYLYGNAPSSASYDADCERAREHPKPVPQEGGARDDVVNEASGKAGETGPRSPRAEASPVASEGIPEEMGAKSSNNSDCARSSETAKPTEDQRPWILVDEPAALPVHGIVQDDDDDCEDAVYDPPTGHRSHGLAMDSDDDELENYDELVSEWGKGKAPVPVRPTSADNETTPLPTLSWIPYGRDDAGEYLRSAIEGQVARLVSPEGPSNEIQNAPVELSKTQKRKLERKRAAVKKKVEEAKRVREMEEGEASTQSPD